MKPSTHRSRRLGISLLLLAAPAVAACGKTVPPPAEPPIARRSADEIILAARLSPDVAPKAAFEIHRLDAFAACSAAQARFEGEARFKAQSAGGVSGGILGGIVIGGLGLVGGVVTTALAGQDAKPAFIGNIYGPLASMTAPADAPPLFIALAADDPLIGTSDFGLIESWAAAKRPVEFHLYEQGGHGFGMYPKETTSTGWFNAFVAWMTMHGLVKPAQ